MRSAVVPSPGGCERSSRSSPSSGSSPTSSSAPPATWWTARSRTWTSPFASTSSRITASAPSAAPPSTATSLCAPSAIPRCATCAPRATAPSTRIGRCVPTAARASSSVFAIAQEGTPSWSVPRRGSSFAGVAGGLGERDLLTTRGPTPTAVRQVPLPQARRPCGSACVPWRRRWRGRRSGVRACGRGSPEPRRAPPPSCA